MAAFDFLTIANVLILTHPRMPSYVAVGASDKNVVYSETTGRIIRSQVRGADRIELSLTWRWITAAHLAGFLAWHATYGGMHSPFRVELPAGATALPAGARLKVRNRDRRLEYRWIAHERYEMTVELVEDLPRDVSLPLGETISLGETHTRQVNP